MQELLCDWKALELELNKGARENVLPCDPLWINYLLLKHFGTVVNQETYKTMEYIAGTGFAKRIHMKTIVLNAIGTLQTNPYPDGVEYYCYAPISRANSFSYHHTGPKDPEYDTKKKQYTLQQEIDEMVSGNLIVLRISDHHSIERWLEVR